MTAGNNRMQRSGGRVGFEVNASRAGPLMRVVTSLNHVPLYHRDDGAERR